MANSVESWLAEGGLPVRGQTLVKRMEVAFRRERGLWILLWTLLGSMVMVGLFLATDAGRPRMVTEASIIAGMAMLMLTLFPSNLIRFARLSKVSWLSQLAVNKKDYGIASGVFFCVHCLLGVLELLERGVTVRQIVSARAPLLGSAAAVIVALLLATSNAWSQRKLGSRWKTLQRLVYAMLPIGLAHGLLASRAAQSEWGWLDPTLVGLAGSIVAVGAEFVVLQIHQLSGRWVHLLQVLLGCGLVAAVWCGAR